MFITRLKRAQIDNARLKEANAYLYRDNLALHQAISILLGRTPRFKTSGLKRPARKGKGL
jgi:hypothetical protein